MERKNIVSDNTTKYYIYLANDGTFAQVNEQHGVNVGAFRSYFSCPTGTSPAKDIEFESTTGINHYVSTSTHDGNIYNLNGTLVAKDGNMERLPKGIYILNGKKISSMY